MPALRPQKQISHPSRIEKIRPGSISTSEFRWHACNIYIYIYIYIPVTEFASCQGGQDSTSGDGGGDDAEREGEEGVEEIEMLDDLVLGVNDPDSDEEEEQGEDGDDEDEDWGGRTVQFESIPETTTDDVEEFYEILNNSSHYTIELLLMFHEKVLSRLTVIARRQLQ
jgi:hypothetical protein